MSAEETISGHSTSCCNEPPVVSRGYKPRGLYEDIGGFQTYTTGPDSANKAIIVIYDIFGYFEQTIQGADILAYSPVTQKYKVFIPDIFKGQACSIQIVPPNTDEKKQKLAQFLKTWPPSKTATQLPDYVRAVKKEYPSLTSYAILGYCWGGKVATVSAQENRSSFSAMASLHPTLVDPTDADGVTVPTILLASGDEPADHIKQFEERLKVPKHVETFKDQIHGWMSARANLEDEKVRKEYNRGYKTVIEFFGRYL